MGCQRERQAGRGTGNHLLRRPGFAGFSIDGFAKGERSNLTQAERNELRQVLGGLAAEYRERAG